MAAPWYKASLPYKSLVDGTSDYWTLSGTAGEYYYNQGDLSVKPLYFEINGEEACEGTIGSLVAGEWAWDSDNNRPVVHITGDGDPDAQASGYIRCSDQYTVATVGAGNILTVGSIRITNNAGANAGANDANFIKYYYDDTETLLYEETQTLLATDSPFRDSAVLRLYAGYEYKIQSNIEDVAIYLSGIEEAE
jgi:hypothetical protein